MCIFTQYGIPIGQRLLKFPIFNTQLIDNVQFFTNIPLNYGFLNIISRMDSLEKTL